MQRLGSGLIIRDARKFLQPTHSRHVEAKSSTSSTPTTSSTPIEASLESIRSVIGDLRHNLRVSSDGNSFLLPDSTSSPARPSQPLRISLYFNRVATPWHVRRDRIIQQSLGASGVNVRTFKGVMLYEPWEVRPSHVPGALTHGFGSVGFFIR